MFIYCLLFVGRIREACCPHWVLISRAVGGGKHKFVMKLPVAGGLYLDTPGQNLLLN